MPDAEHVIEIILTDVPARDKLRIHRNDRIKGPVPGWDDRLGLGGNDPTIGIHDRCEGNIELVRTWEHGGVIVCKGGCNLRIPVYGPPTTYRALKDMFAKFNEPPRPVRPEDMRHDG